MSEGPITKALMAAVDLRRKMLDDGMSAAEVDRIVGQGLQSVLGSQREWRFYCEHCRDTGWINVRPSPEEEARLLRLYGSVDQAQGYVVKCEPCKWNQMQREQRRRLHGQDIEENDYAAAGQTTKRGFKKLTR